MRMDQTRIAIRLFESKPGIDKSEKLLRNGCKMQSVNYESW
jgi:hypothetical protein